MALARGFARRRAGVAILVTVTVLASAGCLGGLPGFGDGADGSCPSATVTGTPVTDGSLIDSAEALRAVDGDTEACADASLYYVAGNGTWYHAVVEGDVLERAPNGSETVVGNTTVRFDRSARPLYVWKLTFGGDLGGDDRRGASTYVVHARNGTVLEEVHTP